MFFLVSRSFHTWLLILFIRSNVCINNLINLISVSFFFWKRFFYKIRVAIVSIGHRTIAITCYVCGNIANKDGNAISLHNVNTNSFMVTYIISVHNSIFVTKRLLNKSAFLNGRCVYCYLFWSSFTRSVIWIGFWSHH